jgi:hypothetical protein
VISRKAIRPAPPAKKSKAARTDGIHGFFGPASGAASSAAVADDDEEAEEAEMDEATTSESEDDGEESDELMDDDGAAPLVPHWPTTSDSDDSDTPIETNARRDPPESTTPESSVDGNGLRREEYRHLE